MDAFRRATGKMLVAGTINVEVGQPIPFQEDFRVGENEVPRMFGWSGDYLFQKCRIEGAQGYRIKGGHAPDILEIMSATRITKNGHPLKDGDELLLEFF